MNYYRRKEPLRVEVEWGPGGQEAFFDLLSSIPIRCGNCAERFVDKKGDSPCPNCGEEPTWDPPTCPECLPLEEAGGILPDCPACDSLTQDYESNKLSDEQSFGLEGGPRDCQCLPCDLRTDGRQCQNAAVGDSGFCLDCPDPSHNEAGKVEP